MSSLPDLLEVVPIARPVKAQITVPGSKSITNRALILAALAQGETTLRGALWSEDTQVMTEALARLGFSVTVAADPREPCNRTITLEGRGGTIPTSGTASKPLELFVGNAGTAARFLSTLVCLGQGVFRLHGVARMAERPQAPLFQSLRQLGYRIETPNDRLPAVFHGAGPRRAACSVGLEDSSQFASGLLLCSGAGGWTVNVTGLNEDEAPYVRMTEQLIASMPRTGGEFQIEPDASSGSYFQGAAWLLATRGGPNRTPDDIVVRDWPRTPWQVDASYPAYLGKLDDVSRRKNLGDSILTAIALAPFGDGPRRFTDLGRLRVQECERVAAMRSELTKCGICVTEAGDTLEVYPGAARGAEIETYGDHRMAMCFATLGLRVPGLKLRNPACVKKSFPNFFQKLAKPAPEGLGATVLDARCGGALAWEALFAE